MDVTTSQKDLGVISPNLTSSSHYNMICAKAYSSLNFICKNSLRSYCTYNYVLSGPTYAIQLWRHYSLRKNRESWRGKYSAFFTSFTRAGTTGCKKYTRMTNFYHNQKVINILEPLARNKYSLEVYMTYLILVHFITPARFYIMHVGSISTH